MKKVAISAALVTVLVLSAFAGDKNTKASAKKAKAKKEQCCTADAKCDAPCDAPNPWCCEDPNCCLEMTGKKQELYQAANGNKCSQPAAAQQEAK